ncbi:MAG: molybdopterin-dependent oxidoreductase [Halapricum sp.]
MSGLSRERVATALVALAAGLGGVGGSYAVVGPTPAFVVSPVARTLTDVMPGQIIAFMIAHFGSLGQQFNFLAATVLTIVGLGVLAAVGIAVGRRVGTAAFAVATTVGGCWLVAAILTGTVIASAGTGLASGIVVGLAEAGRYDLGGESTPTDRRRVVVSTLTALGLGSLGIATGGINNLSPIEHESVDATTNPGGQTDETKRSVAELKQLAEERSLDFRSIEPLLSNNHYIVDIDSIDPTVDRSSWTLSVTGEVEDELEFDFEELRQLPAENRFVTLRCVGDLLDGREIDTAIWTGVPVSEILDRASPTGDCNCVMLRAADGYYEEFPLSALEDGLLAFGMNGQTLPRAHGYPLRALVPGHWGEVNVKWLTEIELLSREQEGYWEKKGWHGTGPVTTVAKLWNGRGQDGIVHHDDGTIELAGHAYAGTRGIERVEVSTDGGDTWTEAKLTEPLPGEDVWRQWTHTYDSPGQKHQVVVRAVDGTGTLQPAERRSAYPNGATGWVRKTVKP